MSWVVAVAAAVGLAACGGGDDEGLTRAELASRGDAVCRDLDAEVKKAAAEFQDEPQFTPEQMQALYKKLVPLVDDAVEDFKGLDPPEDLEAEYDAALDQIEKDRRTLVGATESQESAQRFYEAQVDPFTATNEKLAAVGITACGGGAAEGDAGAGEGEGAGEGTTSTTSAPTSSTSAP